MEINDLNLITHEIIPPLPGGLTYAAKVQALFVMQGGERKRISHEFGETWGQTDSEARAKMTALVEKWVTSQQKHMGSGLALTHLQKTKGFSFKLI